MAKMKFIIVNKTYFRKKCWHITDQALKLSANWLFKNINIYCNIWDTLFYKSDDGSPHGITDVNLTSWTKVEC